ncbi:hypothetical protein GE061_003999 [Apolygus lucorum]|uniref:Uncharacterized protein n=1 Tax=Apolygus lucorum TaxID=248454 RepID=A0A8S9WY16_APOLU|nr:hypothetical protein GE061_003999 [Apolygus lucorum]
MLRQGFKYKRQSLENKQSGLQAYGANKHTLNIQGVDASVTNDQLRKMWETGSSIYGLLWTTQADWISAANSILAYCCIFKYCLEELRMGHLQIPVGRVAEDVDRMDDGNQRDRVWIKASLPMATPKSKEVLHSQTREFVSRILEYFKQEKENNGPLMDVTKVTERVAAACKISVTTVKRIHKERKNGESNNSSEFSTLGKKHNKPKVVTEVDSFSADALRRHIYAYYSRKEVPTVEKLMKSFETAGLWEASRTSLQKVLKSMGFSYRKLNNRVVLMEKPDIALKRLPCSSDMLKVELLSLVKMRKPLHPTYLLDQKASERGHTVIRLPPYHCHFNPVELVWSWLKDFVGKRNTTFKLEDVKALVHTAVENITPEHWKSYVKHVRGIIDEAWEKDSLTDEEIEQFVISLSGDSSDESSWEEDSDMDEDYDDSMAEARKPASQTGAPSWQRPPRARDSRNQARLQNFLQKKELANNKPVGNWADEFNPQDIVLESMAEARKPASQTGAPSWQGPPRARDSRNQARLQNFLQKKELANNKPVGNWADEFNPQDIVLERSGPKPRNCGGNKKKTPQASDFQAKNESAPKDEPLYDIGGCTASFPLTEKYCMNYDLGGFVPLVRQAYEAIREVDARVDRQMPYCIFLHHCTVYLNAVITDRIKEQGGRPYGNAERARDVLTVDGTIHIVGTEVVQEYIRNIGKFTCTTGEEIFMNPPTIAIPGLPGPNHEPGFFRACTQFTHNVYECYVAPAVTAWYVIATRDENPDWDPLPAEFTPAGGVPTHNLLGYEKLKMSAFKKALMNHESRRVEEEEPSSPVFEDIQVGSQPTPIEDISPQPIDIGSDMESVADLQSEAGDEMSKDRFRLARKRKAARSAAAKNLPKKVNRSNSVKSLDHPRPSTSAAVNPEAAQVIADQTQSILTHYQMQEEVVHSKEIIQSFEKVVDMIQVQHWIQLSDYLYDRNLEHLTEQPIKKDDSLKIKF